MLNILIVEDDELDAKVIERALKQTDITYQLLIVGDAESALKKLQEEEYDVIFSDYQLPKMDGLELLKKIKEIEIETPVIVMTSQGSEKIAVELMKNGAFDYFNKSETTPHNLMRVINGAQKFSETKKQLEQKDAELKDLTAKVAAVIASTNDSVFIFDIDYKISMFNFRYKERMNALYGTEVKEGTTLAAIYKQDAEAMESLARRAFSGEQVMVSTYIGEEKQSYVQASVSPIYNEKGEVTGAAIISRDISEIKQVEDELKLANARFNALIESTNDAVFIYDKNKKLILFNSAYGKRINRLYGRNVQVGDSIETIYGKDAVIADKHISSALSGVPTVSSDYLGEKEERYIEANRSPIYNENGEVVAVAVIARDITDIKRVEEELQVTNARFNAFIESTNDTVFIFDKDRKLLLSNSAHRKRMKRLYGRDIQIGDSLEMIYGKDVSKMEEPFRRALSGKAEVGSAYMGEIEKRYIEASRSPVYNEKHEVVAVAVIARDITDIKRIEEELQLTNTKLNALIESTNDIILAIDAEMKFMVFNSAYQHLVKNFYGGKIQIGDKYTDHFPEGNAAGPSLINNIKRCLKGEQFTVIDSYGENSSQKAFFEINYSPIYEGEKLKGVAVFARNITEKVRTEQELIRARNEAINTARYKSEFLSNMSHEIRTPMNGILGITNLLMEKELDKETTEYLKTVKYSADNLMVIINDILDFSKIEAGKVTIESIAFNIRDHIHSIKKTFQPRIKEKGLTMSMKVANDIPAYLTGDPYRLNQILVNLIGNAIKFTPEGSVAINVVKVKENKNDITIRFDIQDTGIGIPKNKQKLIFESFTQANTDTARHFGGTGLGLAITRNLVSLQGGKIKLTSKEGEGSVFSIEIPYKKTEGAVNEKQQELANNNKRKSIQGLRILIVEDNAVNQFLIKQIITKWEAICTIANNGKEGIDLLSEQDFDIVLMDLQMPELSGFEAADVIRNENKVRDSKIPIIALTADAFSETKQKVLEAGMNDFVPKPFDKDELYSKIIKLCL